MAAQTQRNAWEWVIKLSNHTRHNAMQSHCSSVSKTDYINCTAQSADSIFRGMSQQAVALVTSRMWRLRHLTQVFHVLSIEVWNPTFWKNSKQPMLTSNHYAVKGIIGQSNSRVSKRALPFIPDICHFWYATALFKPSTPKHAILQVILDLV